MTNSIIDTIRDVLLTASVDEPGRPPVTLQEVLECGIMGEAHDPDALMAQIADRLAVQIAQRLGLVPQDEAERERLAQVLAQPQEIIVRTSRPAQHGADQPDGLVTITVDRASTWTRAAATAEPAEVPALVGRLVGALLVAPANGYEPSATPLQDRTLRSSDTTAAEDARIRQQRIDHLRQRMALAFEALSYWQATGDQARDILVGTGGLHGVVMGWRRGIGVEDVVDDHNVVGRLSDLAAVCRDLGRLHPDPADVLAWVRGPREEFSDMSPLEKMASSREGLREVRAHLRRRVDNAADGEGHR